MSAEAEDIEEPTTPATRAKLIRTREKLENKPIEEVKEYTDSRLGTVNTVEIDGHPPGTLLAKSARADGSPQKWRIFFEWEPAS